VAPDAQQSPRAAFLYDEQCWDNGSAFTDPSCNCLNETKHQEFDSRPTIRIILASWCARTHTHAHRTIARAKAHTRSRAHAVAHTQSRTRSRTHEHA
jgi:hypothetical protein